MSKFLKSTTALMAVLTLASGPAMAEKLGLGRTALPEEIAAWNLDISPDGTGLPEGSGDAIVGEEIFADQCAVCHGDFAEGIGNWPKLAGGANTLDREDPLKTVGSYWPHLSTAFDYIRRSMPYGNAGTLTDDETYAIVAYILYSNDLCCPRKLSWMWKCPMRMASSLMTAPRRNTAYGPASRAWKTARARLCK